MKLIAMATFSPSSSSCDTTREEHGVKFSLEHKISRIGTQITRIRKDENIELCDIVKLFYCAKLKKQNITKRHMS